MCCREAQACTVDSLVRPSFRKFPRGGGGGGGGGGAQQASKRSRGED